MKKNNQILISKFNIENILIFLKALSPKCPDSIRYGIIHNKSIIDPDFLRIILKYSKT